MNTVSPEKATPRPMDALKPCPFCDGAADKIDHGGIWSIECNNDDNCFGPEVFAATEDEVLALWNRRAALPAPAGAVEARPTSDALEVTDAEIKAFRDKYREMWPGSWPDRESTIELLTASKRAVAVASDAFRSTLAASAPASPAIGVQAVKALADRVRALLLVDQPASWEERRKIADDLDALTALHPAPEAASPAKAEVDGNLEKRLRSAHDAFAALEGVANDDLVTVLDAADFLASDTAPSPAAAREMDGHDPRIAELQEIQDGAWGDDPMVRGAARDLIASRDTPSNTAPSPKVSDGVREAAKEALRVLCQTLHSRRSNAHKNAIGKLRAALSQEHAPGRKESQ